MMPFDSKTPRILNGSMSDTHRKQFAEKRGKPMSQKNFD